MYVMPTDTKKFKRLWIIYITLIQYLLNSKFIVKQIRALNTNITNNHKFKKNVSSKYRPNLTI